MWFAVGAAIWLGWPMAAQAACPTAFERIINADGEDECVAASLLRTQSLAREQRLRTTDLEKMQEFRDDQQRRLLILQRRRQQRIESGRQ